jgi:hypothetical protein
MNDLIPIAFFIGCLLATFGLVRVCEWLKPATSVQRSDPSGPDGRRDGTSAHLHEGPSR